MNFIKTKEMEKGDGKMYEMIMLVLLGMLFFWLWMLTDWFYHEPKGTDRTVWFLSIFLLNIAGAFAYLCLRYRENRIKVPISISESLDEMNDR